MKTLVLLSLGLVACDVNPLPVGMFGLQDGFVSYDSVCTGEDADYGHAHWLDGSASYMHEGGVLLADPRFSDEDIRLLQLAADAWCEDTAGACFRVVPRPDASADTQTHLREGQGMIARCGHETTLYDGATPTWATTNRIAGNGVAIRLQLDLAPGDMRMVGVLHEMGHAFGLAHSIDPDSVMYEGGPKPRSRPAPSDVEAWRQGGR